MMNMTHHRPVLRASGCVVDVNVMHHTDVRLSTSTGCGQIARGSSCSVVLIAERERPCRLSAVVVRMRVRVCCGTVGMTECLRVSKLERKFGEGNNWEVGVYGVRKS